MKRTLLFLFIALYFQSCETDQKKLDEVIKKFDNYDFSFFKGKFIYYRSAGSKPGTSIYFVNSYGNSYAPYVVTFDNEKQSVINIDNGLLIKGGDRNYLDTLLIASTVKTFAHLKIFVLGVDSVGNVYMNPFAEDRPFLLRRSQLSTPKDIELYKKYKGNWYLWK